MRNFFYFEENDKQEIEKHIEKGLFGRIIEKIKIAEVLYILNIFNFLMKNQKNKKFYIFLINIKKIFIYNIIIILFYTKLCYIIYLFYFTKM